MESQTNGSGNKTQPITNNGGDPSHSGGTSGKQPSTDPKDKGESLA